MGRTRKKSDSDQSTRGDSGELPHKAEGPYFFPALAIQRRTFCVEVLKREGIKSVVELGCGEGSLLGLLTQPASHLDDFPPIIPPPPVSLATSPNLSEPLKLNPLGQSISSYEGLESHFKHKSEQATCDDSLETMTQSDSETTSVKSDVTDGIVDESALYHILSRVPAAALYETQIHLRKIYGLDIRQDRLELAMRNVAPPSPIPNCGLFGPAVRWEPLTVELWLGSLIHYVEVFEETDCIVMSEVIEHLPPDVFEKFIPIVFRTYNPRIIIITTPNHDFNRYFDPKSPQSADHRFLDPTGRTSRIFRDEDHKFEWTEDEFKEWCDQIIQEYEYDVEITGCGSYGNYFGGFSMDSSSSPTQSSPHASSLGSEPAVQASHSPRIPPPPHPDRFFATQCAIFRKKYSNQTERQTRSPRPSALTFYTSNEQRPSLFKSYVHPVSPHADLPTRSNEIVNEVRDVFRNSSQLSLDLRELWFGYPRIPELCGGRVILLVSALFKNKREWELTIDEDKRGLDALGVDWLLPIPSSPPPPSSVVSEFGDSLPPSTSGNFAIENEAWGSDGQLTPPAVSQLADQLAGISVWGEVNEPRETVSMPLNSTGW